MSIESGVILFIFGLAIGSFLNVLALRYDGERWDTGGRSRCPHCGHTLRWFELIPLISFIIQGGKCRNCRAKIGWKYPLVELLSAAIFVAVPWRFAAYPWLAPTGWYIFSAFWIVAFELLLLVAYIDLRLEIVPDELVVVLGALAIFETIFVAAYVGAPWQSFVGPYAAVFWWYGNAWAGHIAGAVFGGGFFALLVIATRGKGMGMGDVKLGIPLGLLFGWPDILILYAAAFIIGSVVGLASIARGIKSRKSPIPFVPFLALGAAFVFFLGTGFFSWYFRIIGL